MAGPYKPQSPFSALRRMQPGVFSGGQSPSYQLLDIFTDTPGTNITAHTPTPGPGGAWTAGRGTWTIQVSGQVSNSAAAGDGEDVAWIDCGVADLTLTVNCLAGLNGEIRVVANVVDADHLFLCYINSTVMIIFEKTAASTYTNRGSATITALTAGNPYTVTVVTNGNQISFTYGGTTVLYNPGNRTGKTATKFGIGGLAVSPPIKFTSFKATSA